MSDVSRIPEHRPLYDLKEVSFHVLQKTAGRPSLHICGIWQKKMQFRNFFVRKQDFSHLIKTERQRGGYNKFCIFSNLTSGNIPAKPAYLWHLAKKKYNSEILLSENKIFPIL